jgi:FolB domain-containing protein
MSDTIRLRDLDLCCLIGTQPDERKYKQNVVLNVVLECDLAPAGRSDRIEDTVNYKHLKRTIVDLVENSNFYLIERIADRVAALCLEHQRVQAVTVTVDKPGALTRASSVAVEIRRTR